MAKRRSQQVEVKTNKRTGETFLIIQLTDRIKRQLAPPTKSKRIAKSK